MLPILSASLPLATHIQQPVVVTALNTVAFLTMSQLVVIATEAGLYTCLLHCMVQWQTSHLLWCIGRAPSSNRISDVKRMVVAGIGRVVSSVDEECVGVPSGDIDDWDEGGVEVPCYAPARTTYR